MTITFTIEYITPKEMDDLSIELFEFLKYTPYKVTDYEITDE